MKILMYYGTQLYLKTKINFLFTPFFHHSFMKLTEKSKVFGARKLPPNRLWICQLMVLEQNRGHKVCGFKINLYFDNVYLYASGSSSLKKDFDILLLGEHTIAFPQENQYIFPKFQRHFTPMKSTNEHHRRSIRLKEYDYSQSGEYFITICTHDHECTLGEIVDGEMRLNETGKIVEEEWLRTPNIRSGIELDIFIIMPNHIHGIIIIKEETPIPQVGTHSCASLLQRQPRSLGSIIAGFKSVATKRINELRNTPSFPVWQKSFFDRVIRNENELCKIRDYIQNNILEWAFKRDDPDKIPLW